MSSADDLRAQLAVAELEEELAASKDAKPTDLKHDLRYARWKARGGHLADEADDNRADAAHRERYEQEG